MNKKHFDPEWGICLTQMLLFLLEIVLQALTGKQNKDQ